MYLGKSVHRLKSYLKAEGVKGLAVDLDDTSYHTSDAFYELLSKKFQPPEHLTRDEVRKHFSLTGKILYWGEIPEAKNFAHRLADDPKFHSALRPMIDALAGISELDKRRALACYLTTRSENLREATEVLLQQHNFPKLPLGMKSRNIGNSAEWKAAALDYLFPEINGIIDNDARIAGILQHKGYQGKIFLVGLNEEEYQPSEITTPVESWSELTKIILQAFPEQ